MKNNKQSPTISDVAKRADVSIATVSRVINGNTPVMPETAERVRAALIADGYHARTDGFTSLAVLAGAVGVWQGFPLLDPIVGLGIGVAILGIVWKSAQDMWHRMMDAVDPGIYEEFRHIASHVDGVKNVHSAAIRWVGHRLWGEMHVTVDCKITVLQGHFITEEVRHVLFHEFPALVEVVVHADPCECDIAVEYHPTAHHHFLPSAD